MAENRKMMIKEPVTGYGLDPDGGMFSIVLNEATRNIFSNPSIEYDTNEFTAVGGTTISRSIEKQSKGGHSLKVVTNASVGAGVYKTIACTSGQSYTFSVDTYGNAGVEYELIIRLSAGTVITRKPFRSLRTWKRPYISFLCSSSANHDFCVFQKNARAHSFYTDAWQLENKKYVTTYCDGDMEGYVIGEQAYRWEGKPHASPSTRNSLTRSGGREYFLSDFNFHVTAITGLGMAPVNVFTKEITSGGDFYIGSNYAARPFSLIGTIYGNTVMELYNNKKKIERLVDLQESNNAQEILMRYRPDGDPIGSVYDIKCHYVSGLEGNIKSLNEEQLAIQFNQSTPEIQKNTVTASFTSSVNKVIPTDMASTSNGAYIKRASGEIVNIFATASSYPNGLLRDACYDMYGGIYFVGDFTSIGGVSANRIAYYNNGVFTACGSGLDNNSGEKVLSLPDGRIIVSGTFTTVGADAAKARLAMWNPFTSTWSAVGSPNNTVSDIMYLNSYLYVVGSFTNIGGSAINYIARTAISSLSVFSAIGTFGGVIDYISGYFNGTTTTIYAISNTTIRLRKTTDFSTWTDVQTGSGSDLFFGLWVDENGTFYYGFYDATTTTDGYLYRIDNSNKTSVLVFESSASNSIYITRRGIIIMPEEDKPKIPNTLVSHPNMYCGLIYYVYPGQFYLGDTLGFTGSYVITENNIGDNLIFCGRNFYNKNTITNNGTSKSYPVFTVYGPGVLFNIKNLTTKQYIYFNRLVVVENETVTIYMSEKSVKVISSFYGDISSKIISGYSPVIHIAQGDNEISVSFYAYYEIPALTTFNIVGANNSNTDNGILYVTSTTAPAFNVYKDSARTQLVAAMDGPYPGGPIGAPVFSYELGERNSSGLFGWFAENSFTNANYTMVVGRTMVYFVESYSSIDGLK